MNQKIKCFHCAYIIPVRSSRAGVIIDCHDGKVEGIANGKDSCEKFWRRCLVRTKN